MSKPEHPDQDALKGHWGVHLKISNRRSIFIISFIIKLAGLWGACCCDSP